MRKQILTLAVVVTVWASPACAQPSPTWTQLSLSTCRVGEFLASNPASDGRGVVIAILDTGVDPSIPGLTLTPDGQVKVVDVQDCTDQGDVELHRVRLDPADGTLVDYNDEGAPIHYTLPDLPAGGGEERRFWFGFFDEKKFINSDVPDLNDNGATDDRFPLMVTALAGDGDDQAVCYVDTDLDRDFADEKPLRSYRLNYDTFNLHRKKPEEQIVPVTFAINIFLRQSRISVHYDDGAHGTHVAGIAAGYRINNQEGFNGVAPGAKLMSLKIGQNAEGGVTTTDSVKKALEYAGRYARQHGVPVVCNMSYGVESVIEGNSDIDEWMDEYLAANPYLVFCTSAGNEGPGLSSVGTPAAANQVISVAAMLATDSAREVMGMTMSDPAITVFSSRGGELDKPDLAAPGWCTSTVPRWVTRGDYWAGTSMASPYAAGLAANLISHSLAKDPDLPVRACDVRRALCLAGKPVTGATVLDAGYGCPDLPSAARLIEQLVPATTDDPVLGYDISTPCPHGHKGRARAAYWRGTWFPDQDRRAFTIKPIFGPGTDAAARTAFVRKFELRTDVPWLGVPQREVYLRSEQSARVYVEYDASQLTEVGTHIGIVEAVHDGQVAFRLINTVVVPYRFTSEPEFQRSFKNRTVAGWTVDRYFVAVPPGASAMHVKLSAPEGEESKASIERIFRPTGEQHRVRSRRLDTAAGKREVDETFTHNLQPGVWEIDVVADRPDKQWPYDLTVRFAGLQADPDAITELDQDLAITNMFDRPVPASCDGRIEGFRMHKEDQFKGLKDELTYSVSLDENYDRIRLDLEMTPEAYATTTDIGVAVESDGEAIYSSAFSNRTVKATVPSGGAKSLKVVIRSGFAVSDDQRETPITVNIDRLLATPVPIEVTRDGSSSIDFVPGVPIGLELETGGDLPEAPDGTSPVGYLRVRERSSENEVLRIPVDIED